MPNIDLAIRFPRRLPALAILDRFQNVAQRVGVDGTMWRASDSGDDERPGGFAALRKYIASRESEIDIFVTNKPKHVLAKAYQGKGDWLLEFVKLKGDADWVRTGIETLRSISDDKELINGYVHREPLATTDFPVTAPIAGQSYAVLVTDAQVNDAYDDPAVFWKAWDNVETLGNRKLCTRALDALGRERWLGETFERTMALARAAKPKRTAYPLVQFTGVEGPWWDYGDVQDEKAGWPMLDLVGYEPKTKTLEYAAKPNHRGHVLIQELQTLKGIVDHGKSPDGEPVKVVRVVFADEKQARTEKRPLLDVGAKVYYLDKKGDLVELTI